jgi:hypothetical protein
VALELPVCVVSLGKLVCLFVIVSSSRFDLCDHLSEERVERDLSLCELLNEDEGFFVNLNHGIKSCVSCHLYVYLLCCCFIYLHVEPIL